MTPIITLTIFFALLFMTTGRRLFVYRRLQTLLEEPDPDGADLDNVRDLIDDAIEHDRATRTLESAWIAQRSRPSNPQALEADRGLDRFLGAFARHLTSIADLFGHNPELVATAQAMRQTLFPEGVRAIIHQTYIEQHSRVEHLLDLLRGPLTADVAALGLETTVAQLAALQETYGDALTDSDGGIAFSQVRAARLRGHDNMLWIVSALIAHFGGASQAHIDARTRLLAPLMAQQEAVARLHRQRRPVTDVDPETGDPVSNPTPLDGTTPQPEV